MNKIKPLFWILLLSFLGTNLTAQKIYRDGYVVKKTGETLNGLVGFSINQKVPSYCDFKRFDIARLVKYKPEEVNAFGYTGGNRYESKSIDGKISFFEVIVQGKITLYQKDSQYFIDKENLGLVALKNGPVKYKANNEITEYKNLQDFLTYITEGKAGPIPEPTDLNKEIEAIIIEYNRSTGDPFYAYNRQITEKQLSQKALESGQSMNKFGVVTGVNIYMLNLTQLTISAVPEPETELASVIGLTYERLLTRKNDRLALKVDLLYLRQTFYNYQETIHYSGGIQRDDIYFSFRGIKIPIQFQYSLTGNRIIPYISVGGAYNYFLQKKYLRIEEFEVATHTVFTTEYQDFDLLPGEITAVAGIGMRTRLKENLILNIQGRFEMGTGIINPFREEKRILNQNSMQANILIGLTF
jgi:hypothetical protein